jgi:hypothetical protein
MFLLINSSVISYRHPRLVPTLLFEAYRTANIEKSLASVSKPYVAHVTSRYVHLVIIHRTTQHRVRAKVNLFVERL